MEKSILTFNDLPEVVAQLRDEVMSLKSLLAEQRSVNNAKTVDTHVPMSDGRGSRVFSTLRVRST